MNEVDQPYSAILRNDFEPSLEFRKTLDICINELQSVFHQYTPTLALCALIASIASIATTWGIPREMVIENFDAWRRSTDAAARHLDSQ